MEFYRLAAGDYRPLPELPNRTSPSRGPRGLKKYCEHSVEQAIYRFFASDHEVPDEMALEHAQERSSDSAVPLKLLPAGRKEPPASRRRSRMTKMEPPQGFSALGRFHYRSAG